MFGSVCPQFAPDPPGVICIFNEPLAFWCKAFAHPVTRAGGTFCSTSLVKAEERLTELFIHFLLNFLLLPAFPVLTQPLGLWGRKKTQQVSLQYWFECSGKQESWVIGPKLTFVCEAEMTCKRWVTSGDRKSVVTRSELSRLQFSSSVYKILIGKACKHLCVH